MRAPQGTPVSPLARRLAALGGVDLANAETAVLARRGRRVRAADVAALRAAPSLPRPAMHHPAPALPVRGVHMSSGGFAPQVAQAVEADFFAAEKARLAASPSIGANLVQLAVLIRAMGLAMADYPLINASFDGVRLVVHARLNLGVVLAHPGGPANAMLLGDARALTLAGIVQALKDGGTGDHGSHATHWLHGFAGFGGLAAAPEVPAPCAAILAAGQVARRAMVRAMAGGDTVSVRPVMGLVQRFDHRAFDGAYSAAYLARLCALIETHDWAGEMNRL